ncbi:SGNH/GDSL hydrolase family protein [Heyndrickxia sporothermodurans]
MRKIITLLLAILLLVSGCSTGKKEHVFKRTGVGNKSLPSEEIIPKKISIVSVGDSLTQGVGDSTNQGGYIPYLRNELESLEMIKSADFQNFGVRGNRTDQLEQRLSKSEITNAIQKADLVIITIGGNDIMKVFRDNFSNLELKKFEHALIGYKQRLDSIVKTIRNENPKTGILLIGVYNPFMKWFSDIKEVDEIIQDWNNTSRQVINQYKKTEFIPVADIFEKQEENLLYTDYFHPNDKGYKLIAERVFSYLNNGKLSDLIK